MFEKIDAHQHYWDTREHNGYGWIEALEGEPRRRLCRPILPPELEPLLARAGISRSVLVQVAETEAEGHYLLSLAERCPSIAGVVIWLDMEAADFAARLAHFRQHPKFVGIRPMIENRSDPSWMLQDSVRRAFGVLEQEQVCFDLLVRPPQLEAALLLLDEFPHLHAVVDHIAKPYIARGVLEPWINQMGAIAQHEQVHVKLSGMITEADHARWSPGDLLPYLRRVLDLFPPERLMFGSDWPVCTLAGSYEQVLSALLENLDALAVNDAAREQIFGGTAARFYRL
jgi:L-fucono-1,5-lactonase